MTKPNRTEMRRNVLAFLGEHRTQTFHPREIAGALDYRKDHTYGRFRDVLDELEEAEEVTRTAGLGYGLPGGDGAAPEAAVAPTPPPPAEKKTYAQPTDPNKAIGTLEVHPGGFGFVEVEGQEDDYFIRERHMGTALDGDVVLVGLGAMQRHHVNKRRECEVLEVLDRRRTQAVGTFQTKGHFAFVEPDDHRLLKDIYVPREGFNGARDDDKVVVSIDQFDAHQASPEGRVLRVIGPSQDPRVRVLSLAMSMDVRADFPEAVEAEAAAIPEEIPSEEINRRLDLRDEAIFTIDPFDAKDFDDAIHIKQLPNGNYEVGVHIADVSHYVGEDTAIGEEAYARGTSVYLVDRTVPMLPEKLSNEVCSLRPEEDKLAFSCIMQVNRHGEVEGYELRESIIHSKQRFTYEEAQDRIDGGYADHPLAEDVVRAARLSRTLTKKRMHEGSVDFETPEVKVLMDAEGHPVDIIHKKRQRANRMIEEFMLLANQVVARHIGAEDPPRSFVYRVHDAPDAERIQQLAEYVRIFGYELPLTDGNAKSTDLNDLLGAVRGTPEDPVIERAALRAMAKAKYSPDNIGHYGLGFRFYTHFTSPIRRYPDLMVHRLLKHYATGGDAPKEERLAVYLDHCSERERAAVKAERESVKLKQVEYAQEHVGDKFAGVVSGVTKFGVFIEITELLVEGLVHVRDMTGDYYEYDESTFRMTGERTGRTYRPGDVVKVQITAANPEKREIDLVFVDDE